MPTFLRTDASDPEYVLLSSVEKLRLFGTKAGPVSICALLPNTTATLVQGLDRDVAEGVFRDLLKLTGQTYAGQSGTWLIEWNGTAFTGQMLA